MRMSLVELMSTNLERYTKLLTKCVANENRVRISTTAKKYIYIVRNRKSELKKMSKESKQIVNDLLSELACICLICKKYPTAYVAKIKKEIKNIEKIQKNFVKAHNKEERTR